MQETGTSLRNELELLASQRSFTISGINELEDEAANLGSEGSLDERLKSLMSGYNYLLVHDATGEISELRILGPHASAEELERRASVKTSAVAFTTGWKLSWSDPGGRGEHCLARRHGGFYGCAAKLDDGGARL